MARDEAVRALQNEEKRYQIGKDLSDNITISYNSTKFLIFICNKSNTRRFCIDGM
jgi:hypothetical protein